MTAQVPGAKSQHKYMGSKKAVGTSLHLALQLRSYLLSTFMRTWNTEDSFLGRGPSMEIGRDCLLLSFPPLPPSVHCCSSKKGCGEQSISSPRVQVAVWSQLSDAAPAPLVTRTSKRLWTGGSSCTKLFTVGLVVTAWWVRLAPPEGQELELLLWEPSQCLAYHRK